jgi:hypothetical protein
MYVQKKSAYQHAPHEHQKNQEKRIISLQHLNGQLIVNPDMAKTLLKGGSPIKTRYLPNINRT